MLVNPTIQEWIAVHGERCEFVRGGTLTDDLLPGFALPVAELFDDL